MNLFYLHSQSTSYLRRHSAKRKLNSDITRAAVSGLSSYTCHVTLYFLNLPEMLTFLQIKLMPGFADPWPTSAGILCLIKRNTLPYLSHVRRCSRGSVTRSNETCKLPSSYAKEPAVLKRNFTLKVELVKERIIYRGR